MGATYVRREVRQSDYVINKPIPHILHKRIYLRVKLKVSTRQMSAVIPPFQRKPTTAGASG